MPLIYNESIKQCNIMIFDHEMAVRETARIICIVNGESFGGRRQGKGRKHPIFMFLDRDNNYICEVLEIVAPLQMLYNVVFGRIQELQLIF